MSFISCSTNRSHNPSVGGSNLPSASKESISYKHPYRLATLWRSTLAKDACIRSKKSEPPKALRLRQLTVLIGDEFFTSDSKPSTLLWLSPGGQLIGFSIGIISRLELAGGLLLVSLSEDSLCSAYAASGCKHVCDC